MVKRIICLFDGTRNEPGDSLDGRGFTNIFRLNYLIDDQRHYVEDGVNVYEPQPTYYYPGIGTRFTSPGRQTEAYIWKLFADMFQVRKRRQLLFGDDLEQIILRSYINLCANYKKGDIIYLFGFSRGAIAARIMSRLISDVGLIRVEYLFLVSDLWETFRVSSQLNSAPEYREDLMSRLKGIENREGDFLWRDPEIEFMGLFDSVAGSLDAFTNNNIQMMDTCVAAKVKRAIHLLSMHDERDHFNFIPLRDSGDHSKVRQIWMPGVHSDVGGGYDRDFLSNVALLTMVNLASSSGDLAINQSECNKLSEKIRADFTTRNIAINFEGEALALTNRFEKVGVQDEIHPIHKRLEGIRLHWKRETRRRAYRDNGSWSTISTKNDLREMFDKVLQAG